MSDETTELLHAGDILWNKRCDERMVVIAANERNVWLRKVGKNDELVMLDGSVWAMLGLERNVKGMRTQSYAQHVFELDGHVEQAASETHGTLTAEQVREAIERNITFYEGGDYDEQAIADELNAKLGSGTCHSTTDSSAWCFVCSECGKSFPRNKLHLAHNHGEINYCPNCGKRVER